MEPLTHRSPNVIGKQNTLSKKEALEMQVLAEKKSQKDKEHPPKPPYYVSEPDGPNGISGERYKTGSLLGKGGFAICYKAELCNERYRNAVHEFALKIVKTQMNQKKMLEKVWISSFCPMPNHADTGCLSSGQNCRSIQSCVTQISSSSTAPSPSKTALTWFWNSARMAPSWTWSGSGGVLVYQK